MYGVYGVFFLCVGPHPIILLKAGWKPVMQMGVSWMEFIWGGDDTLGHKGPLCDCAQWCFEPKVVSISGGGLVGITTGNLVGPPQHSDPTIREACE